MSEMNLSRLYYASTATERYSPLEIGNILMPCRKNNPNLDVTGVLFFGDGYFLQCLEGERANINLLYRKIALDVRHTDVQLLEFKEVSYRYFDEWSMKYVPAASVIAKILKETGLKQFNPYLLDSYTLNAMADVFRSYSIPESITENVANPKKAVGFGIFDIFKKRS
ncbi:BLUF domain-containing protein [Beggiatoa leptomitoformis]|nr:BLUF domain-containing protein [Beggiatoa leptomitoformis]